MDQVERAMQEAFPNADRAEARRILDEYGKAAHEREVDRVRLDILALCQGDLAKLRVLVDRATRDYRDVLYWAARAEGYADPVADDLAAALMTPELTPARLALLHEAVPSVRRVAVLWNPSNASHESQIAALGGPARERDLALGPIAVSRPGDFEAAFAAMRRERASGLIVLTSTLHQFQLRRLADLALRYELPTICELSRFAEAGGLLSYGPRTADLGRRTVAHLRERLMADRPDDPDPEPPELELLVNLRTARSLGLTVPPAVLGRATRVIE